MGIEPQMNQKLCSVILVKFWHSCLHVQRLRYSLHFSFLLNALIQDATISGVLALLDNPQLFGHNLHRIINPRNLELKACACNELRAVRFDCWFHNELGRSRVHFQQIRTSNRHDRQVTFHLMGKNHKPNNMNLNQSQRGKTWLAS